MGNLITTVGELSGEGGMDLLLVSNTNQPEERDGASGNARREADSSARNCIQAAVRHGRAEAEQASSPMAPSLDSRASLVSHRTTHKMKLEQGKIGTQGHILAHRSRRRPKHVRSTRHQPRCATSAPRRDAELRRTTMAATERSTSSLASSPSSLSPAPELPAAASPSNEWRMLPRPHNNNQVFAPQVHQPLVQGAHWPRGLPVDAAVNLAVPDRSAQPRHRSQMRRYVLLPGLSLMVATGMLTVLTWSILPEPVSDDVEQNVTHMARLLLGRGDAMDSGGSTSRASHSSVANNGSSSAFVGGARPIGFNTDNATQLL